MMNRDREPDAETRRLGYEPQDASVRGVAILTACLVVLLGIVLLVNYGFHQWITGDSWTRRQTDLAYPDAPPPRLEAQPARSLGTFMENQRRALHEPHWIDREAGIVAVPIDRAMELYASEQVNAQDSEEDS